MNETRGCRVEILKDVEKKPLIISGFNYNRTSSWVTVKNFIYEASLEKCATKKVRPSLIDIGKVFILIGISLYHLLYHSIAKKEKDIFIGAGSGLLKENGETRDSYLPYDISNGTGQPRRPLIYLLSADNVGRLWTHLNYIVEHKVIIHSFLIAPLRNFLQKIIFQQVKKDQSLVRSSNLLCEIYKNNQIDINPTYIIRLHARFISGLKIFRFLLKNLHIQKCYVVSAYSNSECCASLKERGISITEIQHGIVGVTHRGYNYAEEIKSLPTPDFIQVYNTFWQNELLQAGYFREDQLIISPRYKYDTAVTITNFAKKFICITGQGIASEEILRFISEFSTINPNIEILYAPHPNEDSAYLQPFINLSKINKNIHLSNSYSYSTESWIKSCMLHLSIYSSCHFDALHYKGMTFILDFVEDNIMNYYHDTQPDKFVMIRSAYELDLWMKSNAEKFRA